MYRPPILRIAAMFFYCLSAYASEVTVSGFVTTGGGVLDTDAAGDVAGYSEEKWTFTNDSLFALQVTGTISDKATVTTQLLARGANDFEVDAEWAYISYTVSDSLTARIGRLRTPLYLYSDYVDVGYAYHWLRTPRDVYDFPFNNFAGLDLVKQFSWGFADGSLQFYAGASSFDIGTPVGVRVDAAVNNQAGLALSLNRNWLTFRIAYHIGDVTVDFAPVLGEQFSDPSSCADPAQLAASLIGTLHCFGFSANADQIEIQDDPGYFAEVGLQIDTGRFVAVLEHINLDIEDGALPKYVRQYGMVGVRFGDVLIHYTQSETKDENKDLSQGIPLIPGLTDGLIQGVNGVASGFSSESKTNSVGLRWDFTTSTAFKLQFDDVSDEVSGDVRLTSFAIQAVF